MACDKVVLAPCRTRTTRRSRLKPFGIGVIFSKKIYCHHMIYFSAMQSLKFSEILEFSFFLFFWLKLRHLSLQKVETGREGESKNGNKDANIILSKDTLLIIGAVKK